MLPGVTVLVFGSGGREHALAWKFSQSPRIQRLIVVPGNDGMPPEWERWDITFSDRNSLRERQAAFSLLAQRALKENVNLAFIGPDNALADGIVNIFESHQIPTFGPRAEAARIESSKAFGKEVMKAAGVPTARYWVADSEEEARKILKSVPWSKDQGWVIKADGLALGKGVRVCENLDDALQGAQELMKISVIDRTAETPAGEPVPRLVIEERLSGQELSWMAFCDGEQCALLEPARDYKRLLDGNRGPNTGGMGAISPVPGIPSGFSEMMKTHVFLPVLKELKRRGCEFKGLLYAGMMVDFPKKRFWVLEFNARFGDPETQVLLPRMEGDLLPWCEAVVQGSLKELPSTVPFKKDFAMVVVAASEGYPDCPETGKPIRLPQEPRTGQPIATPPYFFAGARREGGKLLTSGGRVVGAVGIGAKAEIAKKEAYANLGKIIFEGMQFRTDIGRLDS